eukprot:7299336-Alexandrium_andersonii.AAC.1
MTHGVRESLGSPRQAFCKPDMKEASVPFFTVRLARALACTKHWCMSCMSCALSTSGLASTKHWMCDSKDFSSPTAAMNSDARAEVAAAWGGERRAACDRALANSWHCC